jgi:hypothetical protein
MRRVFAFCGAIALAACQNLDAPHDDFTLPTTETNVVGTFLLTSANGQVPPYVVAANTEGTEFLVDDRIVLNDDLTWADTTNYRTELTAGGTNASATATAGSYNISDGHINFTMTTGGNATFLGSVIGNTLTVNFRQHPYVYSR